jgi:hypothetical protein
MGLIARYSYPSYFPYFYSVQPFQFHTQVEMVEWQTERDKVIREFIERKFKLNELLTVNNLIPMSLSDWLALTRTEQSGIYLTVLE